jgi:hypothetical protein
MAAHVSLKYCPHFEGVLVLKVHAAVSSEIFYQSTRHRIPEKRSLRFRRSTPKSRIFIKKFLVVGYRYLELSERKYCQERKGRIGGRERERIKREWYRKKG